MQEHRGDQGKFRLSVSSERGDHNLRLVPSNKVITCKSKWSGRKTGGFKSPANPQFQVVLRRPTECCFTLVRPEAQGSDDGIAFFVCKGIRGMLNRAKRQLADPDIVHQSQYLKVSELSSVFKMDLDIDVPFVVIVCRTKTGPEGEGPFSLSIDSDDYGMEMTEIIEEPPRYKEEMCADILRKYEAPGKVGLLTASPLDEIITVLEQQRSVFIDPTFPPTKESLNDQPTASNVITGIDEWRRLDYLCDNPELFLDGIEPDDMQQGELGDCWFCQAVAAIAQQNPQRLEDLFLQKQYSKYGVYCLKLFVDNSWYYVVIDDYIPCANNKPAFAHSKSPNETWVGLLEKALAKCHGSYQAMIGTGGRNLGAANALAALTGGDSKVIDIKAGDMDEKLWHDITEYNRKKWFMGCGSRGSALLGIVVAHGYSILDAVEAEGLKLLKLRNTWGKTEWLGDWGDDSKLWTPQMKELLHFTNADDGIFWMNFYDFTMQYDHIYMCRITEDVMQHISRHKGDWKARTCGGVKSHSNPQFSLVLDHDGRPSNVLFKLRRDHKPEAEGMVILIYKPNTSDPRMYGLIDKDSQLVASSPFKDVKELSFEAELPPQDGPFTMVLCLEHPDVQDSFRLQVYSDVPHHLTALPIPFKHSGTWRGPSSAGFRSLHNPKFRMTIAKSTRCFLSATRQARGEPDGFCIFVCKGTLTLEQTDDGWVPDEAVVAKSAFLKAHAVQLDCNLDEGSYIVFACHKHEGAQGEGVFTMVLETDDEGSKLDPTA
eukprot:m51a1_g12603 hypothetical protein (769) ;mRNA; r:414-3348